MMMKLFILTFKYLCMSYFFVYPTLLIQLF